MYGRRARTAPEQGRDWLEGRPCGMCGTGACDERRERYAAEYWPDEYAARAQRAAEAAAAEADALADDDHEAKPWVSIGVDVGGLGDATAAAVIVPAARGARLKVVFAKRLGIDQAGGSVGYNRWQAQRCLSLARYYTNQTPGPVLLTVDGTGKGEPTCDFIREGLGGQERDTRISLLEATIVGRGRSSDRGRRVSVSKEKLVLDLVAALEPKKAGEPPRLFFGPFPDGQALRRELMAFQAVTLPSGHVRYEGVGEHDDLPMSVMLALWRTQRSGQTTIHSPVGRVLRGALGVSPWRSTPQQDWYPRPRR